MNLNLIKLGQTVAFLKYLASIDPLGATGNSICSQKNVMTFRGRGLRAKQFMMFSVSAKHEKDKNISAYRLNFFFYQSNETGTHTLSVVCCTIKYSASTERDWNSYLHFQESTCLTFLSWHTQLNLITMDGRCFRTDIKDQ